jgi:hypothetical protein
MCFVRRALLALALFASTAGSLAGAQSPDPKVPAGRDPGGPAVAMIGAGLDYRQPEIARRLARDGEGELIGWDFAGNDARPFATEAGADPIAKVVLAESQTARLVVARVAAGRSDQIALALRFVADTPARVVLVAADPGAPIPRADLSDAARQLPQLLIIVPARMVAADPVPAAPRNPEPAGLLIVDEEGTGATADLLVTLAAGSGSAIADATASGRIAGDVAAARVAALAARLEAREPALAGAALRARILSLAEARPTRPPVVRDIRRLHWSE